MKPLALLVAALATLPALAQGGGVRLAEAHPKARAAYERGVQAAFEGDPRGAVRAFEAALKREPDLTDALVELAGVHYNGGDFVAAEVVLERTLALGGEDGERALYGLAMAEFKLGDYREAAEHLARYLARPDLHPDRRAAAERYRADAAFRAEALAHPVDLDLRRLPATVNSPEAEYLPSLTADANTLVFTRRRGGRDEDFYLSTRTDSTDWGEPTPLGGVNTLENEGAQTVSADGRYLVFTACNRKGGLGSCDLYASRLVDGRWTAPANLGGPVNTPAWESQPSLAGNGELLFFASRRPGGHGKADLYASAWNPGAGRWGEPVNLGPVVNTAEDEQAPFWHADGRTLYFMSDGHPGMGNFDLFRTEIDSTGTWQPPVNLGYPLNTAGNEGAIAVALDGRTAYYATDAEAVEAAGDSIGIGARRAGTTDLFAFTLPPAARAGEVTYVRARVTDAVTGLPIAAVVSIATAGRPFLNRRARGDDGTFLAVLPAGTAYALAVEEPGYLFYSDRFELAGPASAAEPFELDIRLRPLPSPAESGEAGGAPPAGEPVVLRNVLFATASAELLPESLAELARLRDLLADHPGLRIRIQGHTDDVGDDDANQALSERRAAAVRDHLTAEGIAADRLEAAGFGESRPVVPNDDDAARALNRRTEFVVL